VLRIYPGFRGDRVALIGDEIVIVDSASRIVAVLPA
jgi:hypothetical protein